ncbi:MAG: response regulator [Patescibacteria group bacterium]
MSKKLLLVEDDITLRDLYAARFGIENYELSVANDGESGLAMAQEILPDCMLLDLRIPKLNGFEVLRRLKENPKTKKIPVIVLTALSGDEDRRKCLEAGAAAFLTKAETMPKEVLTHVKKVIG